MTDDRKPDEQTDTDAGAIMERLFPVDTANWTGRILAMQKRSVERMADGYSRTPPRIIEKLQAQIEIRDEMVRSIETAIAKAEAAGGHSIVLRYALVDLLKSGRFDNESEPL